MHFCQSILTRRTLLAGVGLAATGLCWSARAQTPEIAPDGVRILRARPGSATLRGPAAPPTPVWGYEGAVPGPILRVKRGDEVRLRLGNDLDEPTAVFWHGVRLPTAIGGMAHLAPPAVAPGQEFEYRF